MTEPNYWTTPYSAHRAILADRLYAALAAADGGGSVAVEEPPSEPLRLLLLANAGDVMQDDDGGLFVHDLSSLCRATPIPLLWRHDADRRIGTVRGVAVHRGQLHATATVRPSVAQRLEDDIREGRMRVSIGVRDIEWRCLSGEVAPVNGRSVVAGERDVWVARDARLHEVSLTTNPRDPRTKVEIVTGAEIDFLRKIGLDWRDPLAHLAAGDEPKPKRRVVAPKPAPRAAATKLRHVSPLEFAADARRAGGDVALVPMRGRVSLLAAGGEALPRFKMLVHSGQKIDAHHFWTNLYIDLAGIRVARQRLAVLLDHDPDKRIGFTTSIKKTKDGLVAEGFLLSTPLAQQVAQEARDGFPFECSCALPYSLVEEVRAGATARVNGMDIEGPATIWRKTNLREVTFTAVGADQATHATVS